MSCGWGLTAPLLVGLWGAQGPDRTDPSPSKSSEPDRSFIGRRRLLKTPARDWLAEAGLRFEPLLTADVLGVRGARSNLELEGAGNLDLILTADLDALVGWSGASLTVHGQATFGSSPSAVVGDVQGVNNIEASPAFRLFEAHLNQSLWKGRLDLKLGLYDTNSEFDVLPAAVVFVHSSFGMGGDVGTSGLNGPSTFPFTSLAFRVQVRPNDRLFVRAVVADGVPQAPNRPQDFVVRLNGQDGVLWMAEVGTLNLPGEATLDRVQRRFREVPPPEERTYGRYGKFAIGAWGYTTAFPQEDGGPDRGTFGMYALAQQAVYREDDSVFDGISLFLRGGGAMNRGHVVNAYVGGGFVYEGLFELPRQDQFGAGVAAAHPVQGSAWEVALEWTYRYPLFGWLLIQPHVQVIFNPAFAGPGDDDGLVFGLRNLIRL